MLYEFIKNLKCFSLIAALHCVLDRISFMQIFVNICLTVCDWHTARFFVHKSAILMIGQLCHGNVKPVQATAEAYRL